MRVKAKILQVGYIDSNDQPQGWAFDCDNDAVGIEIGDDGTLYWGGYSVEELRRIASGADAETPAPTVN